MIKRKYKLTFCIIMLLLLGLSIWVYHFQKKTLNEEFNLIVEHLDMNQDVSSEPDSDPGKNKNATGLYPPSSYSQDDMARYVVKMVNNALDISRTNQVRGPPGPQGPKGNDGLNGGTFLAKGPLRSVGSPGMVVERTYGMGPGARCFLSGQTYLPQQTWILDSEDRLCSQYNPNECLKVSDDLNVYMAPKIDATKFKHRSSTGQLQTSSPIQGRNRCLSTKQMGSVSANHLIQNGKNPTGSAKPLNDKLILLAEDCNNGKKEQYWSFY